MAEANAAPPNAKRSGRIALLIGNSAYPKGRLRNPANDVALLAGVLEGLGFDAEILTDATKAKLETAIVRFGERIDAAAPAAASFFYFAGHGIQYEATNYLLPIDAEIPAIRYLKSGAVPVDAVVAEIARKDCQANVIVLDACRHNPLPEAYRSSRDVTQGLAGLTSLPRRTLVAFSTAAGRVALDGENTYSPYASVLAARLAEGGRTILQIFGEVAADVEGATLGDQSPALFVQGAPPQLVLSETDAGASPALEHKSRSPGGGKFRVSEQALWSGRARYSKDFENAPEMVVVPEGSFVMGDADGAGDASERPLHRVTIAHPFAVSRFEVTLAEFEAFIAATGYKPADAIACASIGLFSFDDSFDRDGKPNVRIHPGRSFRKPGFRQGPNHPVVGVSWHDAKAYAAWLAERTGKPYRLLSEAEWEYAARAGSNTQYWWGNYADPSQANFENPSVRGDWQWRFGGKLRPVPGMGTGPADVYEPNPWGLFNMHGNAAEWVEDAWHDTYDGAPTDGSPWLDGNSAHRVIRGGSWFATVRELRSSARAGMDAKTGTAWVGFRVCRSA